MKEIKLKRLTLNGYRGQYRVIDFSDNETKIMARNGVGKSTIFDAYLQLITRADCRNRSDFEMFDTNREYTREDNPVSEIEGVFDIDGYKVSIKQTAQIKFAKNRTNGEYERASSINYTFSIDDIERSATGYKEWIEANFAPIDKLKCMANIYHFVNNIPKWEEQRKLLAEISGEINNDDFHGDYDYLMEQMKRYSISEIKERIRNQSTPLKRLIGSGERDGEIQVSINALTAALPDVSMIEDYKVELKDNESEIKRLNDLKSGEQEPINEAIKERDSYLKMLQGKREEIRKEQEAYKKESIQKLQSLKDELSRIESLNRSNSLKNEEAKSEWNRSEDKVKRLTSVLSNLNAEREELLLRRDKVKAAEFSSAHCSFCKQELPEDLAEQSRLEFYKKRDLQLSSVVSKGKGVAAEIKDVQSQIESINKIIDEGYDVKPKIDTDDIIAEINTEESSIVDFKDTERYTELMNVYEDLERNTPSIPVVDTSNIDSQIKELEVRRTYLLGSISIEKEYERQSDRIEELRCKLRESSSELSKLEQLSDQIKSYEREYASIVQNKTNALFSRVSVNMLKENKSGDLIDACDILYKGVPSRVWNNAEKSLSAMDISITFMNHYKLKLPIFVDNAESINDDNFWTDCFQVVKLTVSADKTLVVKN